MFLNCKLNCRIMRKILQALFILVTLVLQIQVKAQTIRLGSGNLSNANNPITISNVNQVTKSRSANIYTAAEILQAGGYAGIINRIAWYRNKPSGIVFANNTADIKVYFKQINYQTFDSATKSWQLLVNSSQLVFTDTNFNFDQYAGWKEINLQSTFNWNGTSNLLVLVDFESSQIGASTMSWRSSTINNASAFQSSQFNIAMQNLGRSSTRPNVAFNFVNNLNDVSVSDFSFAPGKCIADSTLMRVRINNHTDSVIRQVQVNWSINNQASNSFIYSTNINSSSSNLVDIGYFNFQNSNRAEIKIWTSNPNNSVDLVPQNDTLINTIAPALSGVYTVSNSSEFKSLTSIVEALKIRGICSSVQFVFDSTIGVQNGPFNLSNIEGNNSANSISFIGNGTFVQANLPQTVIYEENAVWDFQRVQNINIIGFRFKYINNHSIASILNFQDSTSNIIIKKNYFYHDYFKGNSISVKALTEDGSFSKVNLHNYIIDSNSFTQSNHAIFIEALSNVSDSIKISKNKFNDFSSSAITIKSVNNVLIGYNEISSSVNYPSLSLATINGIVISDVHDLNIRNNKIHSLLNKSNITNPTIKSIELNTVSSAVLSNNLIYNVISTLGNYYGVYVHSSDTVGLYYNLISTGSGTNNTSAFTGIYKFQTSKFRVLNNIVHYAKTSSYTKRLVYYDILDSTLVSNNNALVMKTTGGGQAYVGGSNLGDYSTLFTWNLASALFFDSKSTDQDPLFVDINQSNFKVQSIYYDAKASPIANVLTDFDDQLRDISTPDIGPYEFSPAPLDIQVTNARVASGTCSYPQQIVVDIKSLGAVLIDSIAFDWTVNGIPQPRAKRYGHIAQGSQGVFAIGNYPLSSGVNYVIKAWVANVNNQSDINSSNDTTISTINYKRYSGIYSVGGSNADFVSPKAAIDSLNLNGICASVILNVNPEFGPYTDRLLINSIEGLTSNSTLTINGNGSKIIFNTSNTNSTDLNELSAIKINGADFLEINEFNIQIEGDKNSAAAIQILNASNNIIIRNNYFITNTQQIANQNYGVLVSSGLPNTFASVNVNNLSIINNQFEKFYVPIMFNGSSNFSQYSSNNIIKGNKINTFSFVGINLINMDDTKIENNEISMNPSDSLIAFNVRAIAIQGMRKSTLINANFIHDIFLRLNNGFITGVSIQQCVAAPTNKLTISNNIITNIYSRTFNVFQMNSSNNVDFLNNSVSMKQHLSSSIYTGFNISFINNEVQNVNIKNNVLFFDSTAAVYSNAITINTNSPSWSFNSSNNCFFSSTSSIQFTIATIKHNFSSWKTVINKDINSLNVNPNFQSNKILIPKSNSALLNAGVYFSTVSKDYSGRNRSITSPSIGAYENSKSDITGPVIIYNKIPNSLDTLTYNLPNYFIIGDVAGVDTTVNNRPKLFYKRKTDANVFIKNSKGIEGWKYVETNDKMSPFGFIIDYSLLNDTVINEFDAFDYFILAKDNLGNYSISDAKSKTQLIEMSNISNLFPVTTSDRYYIIDTLASIIRVGENEKLKSITNEGGLFHMLNINPIMNTKVLICSDLRQETGDYALEKMNVLNQLNASAIINIEPDKDTIYTIEGINSEALIKFKGAQKIQIGTNTIDKINFKIKNNNTSETSSVISLYSPIYFNQNSNDITISNVEFSTNTYSSNAIFIGTSISGNGTGKGAANVFITNNKFIGYTNPISGKSDSIHNQVRNIKINNNLFNSQIIKNVIEFYHADSLYIRTNTFMSSEFLPSINTSSSIVNLYATRNFDISENNIQLNLSENFDHSEFNGINIYGSSNVINTNSNIYNNVINFISYAKTNLNHSISLINLKFEKNINIYHNSLSISGLVNNFNSPLTTVFKIEKSNAVNIYNNSIQNTLPSVLASTYLYYSSQMNSGQALMNNNQFYSSASQLFFEQNQKFSSLNAWNSFNQQNTNSIFNNAKVDPVTLKSNNSILIAKASNLYSLPFDKEGRIRRQTSSIGAYELDSISTDIALEKIVNPEVTIKPNGTQNLSVIITNYGLMNVSNFNINTNINVNSTLLNYAHMYSKTLLAGQSDTVVIASINVSDITDAANALIYISVLNDNNTSNDTLRTFFCKSNIVANSLINNTTANVCEGVNYKFELNDPFNREIRWYDAEEGGNLQYVGNGFEKNITSDLKYYVQVMGSQAVDSLRTSTSLNYGNPAYMFNIVNTNSYPVYFNRLELNSFSVNASITPHTKIYVRNGSYSSAEFNIASWTYLEGFTQEFVDGSNGLTFTNEVLIPAGGTLGVFVSSTSTIWLSSTEYTGGGAPTYTKAGVEIRPGLGKVSPNIAHTSIPNVVPHVNVYFRTLDDCAYIPRVKYEVKRKFSVLGTSIKALSNNIYINDGTISNPDILCNNQTINYKINNTSIYTDANYNQTWRVVYKEVVSIDKKFRIFSSTDTNRTITFISSNLYVGDLILVRYRLLNISTQCEITYDRYARIQPDLLSISLGNDTIVCEGDVIRLSAGNIPGVTYLWSNGDTSSSILINKAGTYSLTVNYGICKQLFDEIIVSNYITEDSLDYSYNNVGCNYVFTAPLIDDVKYYWNFGDGSIDSGRVVNHIFLIEKMFKVQLRVEGKGATCLTSKTTTESINVSCFVGINNEEIVDINIYPIPSNNKINFSANKQIENIEVYDLQGRIIETFNTPQHSFENYASGVYMIKMTINNKQYYRKIVIEN